MTRRPVRLAIDGLPAELRSLRIGGLYAILADQRAMQEALAVPTLVDALAAKQPVMLVAPFANAAVLEPIAHAGLDLPRLFRSRRLQVLKVAADGAKRLKPLGMTQVLDEFDHYGVAPGGLIIAAPADALFPALADNQRPGAAARLLRQWLRSAQSAMVVVLENPDQELLTDGGFDGVARLRVIGDVLHWVTDFWRLPGGDSISSEYHLRLGDDGRLAIDNRIATGDKIYDAKAPDAADQGRVIATTGVVRGEKRVPARWELVDSHDALLVRAGNAISATCILETDSPSQFQELARAVHQLRRRRGPALKIIVYEIGARLRRPQEQLLLALGANVVVIGSGLDRLQSVVETLLGQRYARTVPADFEEAFAGGLPQTAGGYLPQAAFFAAALDAGKRAVELRLESVVVQMVVRPGIEPRTALAAIQVNRHGDYFTYAEGSVWLHLFGCWEGDAEKVTSRVCRRPLGELFSALRWHSTNAAAMQALTLLQHRLDGQIAEDFSARLGTPESLSASPVEALSRGIVPAPLTLRSHS